MRVAWIQGTVYAQKMGKDGEALCGEMRAVGAFWIARPWYLHGTYIVRGHIIYVQTFFTQLCS